MATVLVAEDEPGVRAVVAAALAHAGHAVLEAADGAEGLRLARAHRPAVVVADRRMPGLDGLALARALKADPALGGARVVLVSGEPADAPAARAAGVDAYLVKPFRLTQLLAAVAPAAAASGQGPPER
jgi:CheY-like chemotaxis protein